jgi:exonuclease III
VLPGSLVVFLFPMDNEPYRYRFLSWNVRGLNSTFKQEDVRQVVNILRPDLICFQETKMASLNASVVRDSIGADFESNFAFLPADGTRGGILVVARNSFMQISNPVATNHTISVYVLDIRRNLS